MNAKILLWLTILLLSLTSVTAIAPYNLTIPFQFTNASNGVFLNGSHTVTAKAYAAPTGGSSIMNETKTVNFLNGIGHMLMADNVSLLIPDLQYWWTFSAAGGTETSPRIPDTPVRQSFWANNASFSATAGNSTYSANSGNATFSSKSGNSTFSGNSGNSTFSGSAGNATYSATSGNSTYSSNTGNSTYSASSGNATYSSTSGNATFAGSSGNTTFASNASGVPCGGISSAASNLCTLTDTNTGTGVAFINVGSNSGNITASSNASSFNITTDGNLTTTATGNILTIILKNIVSGISNFISSRIEADTGHFAQINTTNITATNASVQRFDVNSTIQFLATTTPATPLANYLKLYATVVQGHTRPTIMDDDGIEFVINRDNTFIARNMQGATISKGQAVYINGSTGNVANVVLAQANGSIYLPAVGLAAQNINNGAFGNIMILGILSSIDTSAFSVGDRVFVSDTTLGGLTNVRPVYPNLTQRMGSVLVSGVGNGMLYVTTAPFIGGEESGTTAQTFSALRFSGNITGNATNATFTDNSGNATFSGSSGNSTFSSNSGNATFSGKSGNSTFSSSSGNSTFASNSGNATYAGSSGNSTFSGNSGNSTFAAKSGNATFSSLANYKDLSNLPVIITFNQTLNTTSNVTFQNVSITNITNGNACLWIGSSSLCNNGTHFTITG